MNTENNLDEVITKTDNKISITANNLEIDCITNANNKFSLDSDGNLVVNSITTNTTNNTTIDFDSIYPIGSIYLSVNNTNPSTLFGGTWERIQSQFLLGANDNVEEYKPGKTGGEITHTLAINEMPKHTHDLYEVNVSNNADSYKLTFDNGGIYNPRLDSCASKAQGYWNLIGMNNAGKSQPHNNMPPFLAVYIWKRII